MTKIRDILSVEQALMQALQNLSDEDVKNNTNKSKSNFRKCADPEDKTTFLYQEDAIKLDIASMKNKKGHPLLTLHQTLIDKAMQHHNDTGSVTQSLLHMGERIGKLMGVTEKAMDPNSPGGTSIDNVEKDKIIKALKDVEDKIAALKLSIK